MGKQFPRDEMRFTSLYYIQRKKQTIVLWYQDDLKTGDSHEIAIFKEPVVPPFGGLNRPLRVIQKLTI